MARLTSGENRKLFMNESTLQHHVDELYLQGYTALEGLYSPEECERMREIMDGFWRSQGSPSLTDDEGGFTIHPMMPKVPEMAPFLDRPEPIEVMRRTLRDEVRLVHLGARVSGPLSAQRISWHNHYASNGDGPPNAWDKESLPQRDRIERVLGGIYVDGTMPESGAFITLPREFRDPLGKPIGGLHDEWPGEVRVAMPPGSFAIFDTALWHAAMRGTGSAKRRLWGAHFQGWNDPRPHPEDNAVDAPEIERYKQERPRLRALIQRD